MIILQNDGSLATYKLGRWIQVLDKNFVDQLGVDKLIVVSLAAFIKASRGIYDGLYYLKELYQIVEYYQCLKEQVKYLPTDSSRKNELKIEILSLVNQGNFEEAKKTIEKLIQVTKENNLLAAKISAVNGLLSRIQLRHEESGEYYERAAQLLLIMGYEVEGAEYLNWAAREFNDARSPLLYEHALLIREQRLGKNHPDVATTLSDLAKFYWLWPRNDKRKAQSLYERALAICESSSNSCSDTAAILSNLADCYSDLHKNKEAQLLYERALLIQEKTLGGYHPEFGINIKNLAISYWRSQPEKALPLYKRYLKIQESVLGVNHPDLIKTLDAIAAIAMQIRHFIEVPALYERALVIAESFPNQDPYDTLKILNSLGEFYCSQNTYVQAQLVYERILLITEKEIGADSFLMAMALQSLAELAKLQNNLSKSQALYEQAVSIAEVAVEKDPIDEKILLEDLAGFYCEQGNYKKAEVLYLRALSIGEPDSMLLFTLSDLYDSLGESSKSAYYYKLASDKVD